MTKKEYLTPKMEEWPIRLEGPLCVVSGGTKSLDDFDLLDDGDIVWDIPAL